MNKSKMKKIFFVAGALLCLISCVAVDNTIGTGLIPKNQSFKTIMVDIPIENIEMRMLDSLSGLSSTRITIGAINDDEFGLTTRASAFSLVPFYDTLDFGDPGTQKLKGFHFNTIFDSLSVNDPAQAHILQNVNVYELNKSISGIYDTNAKLDVNKDKRISKNVPVINGTSGLRFEFSDEFANKYMNIKQEDLADMETYLKKYPGIYLDTDAPVGEGGRINIFDLQLNYEDYTIQGNYAELEFSAKYNGVDKDTSFLFYFGADKFYNIDSLVYASSVGYLPLVSLNVTGHSDMSKGKVGQAGETITIEGGGGLKPMIPATEILKMMEDAIAPYGDPKEAIVNKATIILPFEQPENFDEMFRYPEILSPGVKIRYNEDTLSFYILTDYSDSSQDQGDRNMSKFQYAPDFTYHAQSILRLKDKSNISNYDVWFLIQATEVYAAEQQKVDPELEQLYTNLLYSSYYNNMYNGYGYGGYGYGGYGYGGYGYGGYGGYGSSYYYSAMLAQMYQQSETTTMTSSVMVDKDRFYKAHLIGPAAKGDRKPTFRLVFSVPEE